MKFVVATKVAHFAKRLTRMRLLPIALAIALSGITACAQSPDCSREDVFCAALVTDTFGIDDHGLNQDAWAGLQQSQSDGVTDHIAYIESVDARDYEKNILFFVNNKYDVIITSGAGLKDTTLRSADLRPDSVFIGINQTDDESKPNFISVTFPEDQMGFFAGVLATHLTKTNIVGAVCETSGIDAMWRYCEGFRAGVKYANASVKPLIIYRENESSSKLFIDAEWGFENTQTLIHDGADVIFAAGGGTAVGALRAADEAKIKSIGAERDQGAALDEEGSRVVTSVFGQASFTVQELMRRIKDGNFTDAENSPVGYIRLDAILSADLVLEMDEVLTGLSNLTIKTGISASKP
jgi:basic membrane protein A